MLETFCPQKKSDILLKKNRQKSANINTLEPCLKAFLVDNCGIRLNYLLFYSSSLHYTRIRTVQDDSVCMVNVSSASLIMIVKKPVVDYKLVLGHFF